MDCKSEAKSDRLAVTDGLVEASPYPGELDDDQFMDRLYFGSPDTVIEKFRRAADLGVRFPRKQLDDVWRH